MSRLLALDRKCSDGGVLASCLMVLIVLAALSACSSSPNDAELLRAMTTNDSLNGHVYQIQNLRRTNGYETQAGYVVQYSGELRIIEDPSAYLRRMATADNNPLGALVAAVSGVGQWGLLEAAKLATHKKGDVVPFSGSLTMIKSEQGWIPAP